MEREGPSEKVDVVTPSSVVSHSVAKLRFVSKISSSTFRDQLIFGI